MPAARPAIDQPGVGTSGRESRLVWPPAKGSPEEALALWHEFHAGTVDSAEYHRRGEELKAAVSDHLRPRTLKNADNQRLLNELGWHHERGNLVRFLDDPAIPPTNNAGSGRCGRQSCKVSQCSKTGRGAKMFSAFRSVIRTAPNRDRIRWSGSVASSAVLNPGFPRPDDAMPFRESGKDVVGMLINRDSLVRYTANQLRFWSPARL